jgi:hypothetical protein
MSASEKTTPRCAMVLAAGLGTRMRPLTDTMPKPLVKVAGKPLIDHVLDRLAEAGVEKAVINVHHFADQLIEHLGQRPRPRIAISDERGLLLGTGGGVRKALPELGDAPFFHINSTPSDDGVKPNPRDWRGFDPAAMDACCFRPPLAASAHAGGATSVGAGWPPDTPPRTGVAPLLRRRRHSAAVTRIAWAARSPKYSIAQLKGPVRAAEDQRSPWHARRNPAPQARSRRASVDRPRV